MSEVLEDRARLPRRRPAVGLVPLFQDFRCRQAVHELVIELDRNAKAASLAPLAQTNCRRSVALACMRIIGTAGLISGVRRPPHWHMAQCVEVRRPVRRPVPSQSYTGKGVFLLCVGPKTFSGSSAGAVSRMRVPRVTFSSRRTRDAPLRLRAHMREGEPSSDRG